MTEPTTAPLLPGPAPTDRRLKPLTIAAVASLGAGAINAAAIGAHAEHPAAARMFIGVALFQMGWGALALARRDKAVALIGAVGNALLVGGWVLAKWRGLSFVNGLNEVEPIQFADAFCAALAAVSAVAAAGVYFGFTIRTKVKPAFATSAAVVLALAALPGMISAGNHRHAGETETKAIIRVNGKTKVVTAAVVPPQAYDPSKPINLNGVKGVTPAEQARAENLIAQTVLRLPKWSNVKFDEAHGFKSIHDGITGTEHFINYGYVKDKQILNPDRPESLVFSVDRATGTRKLVSAMYMLPPGATLNKVPDIGGPLTQWHVHNNLCFTGGGDAPHVAGLTDANGNCRAPLVKLLPVPMIHVWIVPHPCGPFAALNGVGAGQVKAGDVTNCDHVHGEAGAAGL